MSKQKTSVTNTKLAQLLDLMKENPHLPVVPMIESEVVADDTYGTWMGSWYNSSLDKYYKGEERIYFYDECDMEDLLVETKGWDWMETSSEAEDLEAYRSLPWVKCIVVYITTPED